jgi:hypothetical protein
MRSAGVIVGMVLALGGGYFAFQKSVTSAPNQAPPLQQIDVVSIRQTLLAIGQAERQYLVAHGTYATIEQLAQEDLLPGGSTQRGYMFSAQVSGGDGFTVTATPIDVNKSEWPTLTLRENMQVTQQ